jgi:hypothetical protein
VEVEIVQVTLEICELGNFIDPRANETQAAQGSKILFGLSEAVVHSRSPFLLFSFYPLIYLTLRKSGDSTNLP